MQNDGDIKTGICEKRELVVLSYQRTLDKDLSYQKAGLSAEEIIDLDNDKAFQSRLLIFLLEEREQLIQNLKQFRNSEDEKIAYKASMDLANIFYPELFKSVQKDNVITVKIEKD